MAAYIRQPTTDYATSSSLKVLIDGLTYSAASYYQLDLICYDTNQRIDMRNISGAGGTTGNYRTGVYDFTGLSSGSYYRFYAEARYTSGSTLVRIPSSSYESYQTLEGAPSTPSLQVVSLNGLTGTYKVITGGSTIAVEVDYYWVSGTSDRIITIGSNTSGNYTVDFPNYNTTYTLDCRAKNGSGSYSVWSNSISFTTGSAPIVVGAPTNLTLSNYKSDAITLNWTHASNAWYYQIQYKLTTSGTWLDAATSQSNNYFEITGLSPVTDYDFRVRGYQGSTYGSWSSVITGRTLSNVPTAFGWTYTKSSGGTYNLTANEWNALTSKINQWRVYKGFPNYSFTTVYIGGIFYAYLFNEARSAISTMSPPVTLPASRSSGDIVTASALNGLRDSLNSIS